MGEQTDRQHYAFQSRVCDPNELTSDFGKTNDADTDIQCQVCAGLGRHNLAMF